ncbi:MAG TPA: type III polyketide synthase [Bacteroidales bacterium]|nr:type III polyketide synthase [Bacteroidales bacterium]
MSRIVSIGTAVPGYKTSQDRILEFMISAYENDLASRKLKALFRSSRIETRYSVIPDFGSEESQFFNEQGRPGVNERMSLFRLKALPLALEAIKKATSRLVPCFDPASVTHLIAVTCTGLHSPGLDAMIVKEMKLRDDICRIPINFQGCNAAFPAMKVADMIAFSDPGSKVLVVCVELCTLHFSANNNDDNLLSNTLFGDGAAAMIVVPDKIADKSRWNGFEIKGFYSSLFSEGNDLMGWNIGEHNFEMILSHDVPVFLGSNIRNFISAAEEKLGIAESDIRHWAVHPGGKKILDEMIKAVGLNGNSLLDSYKVLREYGNISSPTILFVLNEIVKKSLSAGDNVFAVGFGPGITMDALWLTYA